MTSSIAAVVEALQTSMRALPDLQIIVKRALPRDEEWIVDHCCAKIYLRADLTDVDGVRALLSGLDVLMDAHVRNGWGRAAIPVQRNGSPRADLHHTRRC